MGPTLPDLKDRLNTDYEKISEAQVAETAAMALGQVLAGVVFDCFLAHRELILCFMLVINAAGIFYLPYVANLGLLAAVFANVTRVD